VARNAARNRAVSQDRQQRSRGETRAPGATRGRQPETRIDFDRIIHDRTRLGIVSALAVNDSLSFNDLKRLMSTTDGNLSVHARRLEEADYITCTKSFDGRIPRTDYKLTAGGKRALERYLNHMEALIKATRGR
jgi:DNA-binding MarR family transcriptional regulator